MKSKFSKKLLKILKEIEEDCIKLKKEGQLADYGKGQLDLILLIKDKFQ